MKKIWILTLLFLVTLFCLWEAGNHFFLIARDQDETLPFLVQANLTINENAKMSNEKLCGTFKNCKSKGDQLAEQLFSENAQSLWANAYQILETFDALIDEKSEIEESEEQNADPKENELTLEEEDELTKIATYRIIDEKLQLESKTETYDAEKQAFTEAIWQSFLELIPKERRSELRFLKIHEEGETEAYIGTYENEGSQIAKRIRPEIYWVLGIDLKSIEEDPYWFLTFLHEFAHLFSLDQKQYGNLIFCEAEFTYECFAPRSYMQNFFKQFWSGVDKDWIEKTDYTAEQKKQFYLLNQASFLNSYASGNPHEDFAESFAAFIIRPSTELDPSNTIDQKQLFFYQYPELVALRWQLLNNLEKIL